jgi:hypothetical protein
MMIMVAAGFAGRWKPELGGDPTEPMIRLAPEMQLDGWACC